MDFDDIRRRCDGMMRPDVYQHIYETALASLGSVFVEVGTAHAAATVCLAKALQDRNDGIVYSFDTFRRGGRAAYRDGRSNFEIATQNLEHFGVADRVQLINGDVRETAGAVPDNEAIDLLMLDADGMIDRDFRTFFDRVIAGAPIIIDDKADRARVKVMGDKAKVDQKHRLTDMLVRSAEKHGLIEPDEMVYQTYFGHKRDRMVADWPVSKVLSVYRNLVFAKAEVR